METIRIFDVAGRIYYEWSQVNGYRNKMSLPALKNGIYLVEITGSDQQKVFKKIVKQ